MRLFIAIDLPIEIQEYFRIIQKKFDTSVKLTKSFHLTLKYLGDVDLTKEVIIKKLNKISFTKFKLQTTELGAFPNNEFIKVLWVGLYDNPELFKLQKNIEKTLSHIKNEFDFHPHITLARVNNKISFPQIKIEKKEFIVNSFVLYNSTLTSSGPIYKKIKVF